MFKQFDDERGVAMAQDEANMEPGRTLITVFKL